MIRAIIYAVLVCGIMTIGLVALDLNKNKPVSVLSEKQELSEVDKQSTKKVETTRAIPTKAKEAKSEDDQVKPQQVSKEPEHITLTALIKGLRNDKGQIIAQLFDNPDAFNNNRYDRAVRTLVIPAKDFAGELRFNQLPPGEYALVLFHDENSNQQFDQTGSLIEGYAYSRNAGKTATVNFRQAAFNADSDKKLNISLIYH